MTNIPQSIKDAAGKEYPVEMIVNRLFRSKEGVAFKDNNLYGRNCFIAGATHPDTEKYYRERFTPLIIEVEETEFSSSKLEYKDCCINLKGTGIVVTAENFDKAMDELMVSVRAQILHLYREQLTNKNTGDECQK